MATRRQVLACRRNGRSGGPKTAAGKAVSRLNARKHGIFASALTEEDAEELNGLHEELAACLAPVGAVEEMLVEKLAQVYLRLQRCSRAEAEWHVKVWEEKTDPAYVRLYEDRCDEGRHVSWFDVDWFERGVQLFGRYDQTLTNQFIKLLHEVERVQRLRGGEDIPAPIVAEVNVEEAACGTAIRGPHGLERGRKAAPGCVRPAEGSAEETTTGGGSSAGAGACATQACETNQIGQKSLARKEMDGWSPDGGLASCGAVAPGCESDMCGSLPRQDTAGGGCATQEAGLTAGPSDSPYGELRTTQARETNQIVQKPLGGKEIHGEPGAGAAAEPAGPSIPPVAASSPGANGLGRAGASPRHGGQASMPACETNQIDQKPLTDKGIQGGPTTAGHAERPQNILNYVRPKPRGQVFFQRKGTAPADPDG